MVCNKFQENKVTGSVIKVNTQSGTRNVIS